MIANAPVTGRRIVTARHVCNVLGIHRETLRRWTINPDIGFPKPINIGKRVYFDEGEVDAFLAARKETEAA